MNTLLFDSQVYECALTLKLLCRVGIDAVIVQDLAVASIVRSCCPKLRLHASTQMTIHTELGLDAVKKLCFSQVVLARELDGGCIAALYRHAEKIGIETEAFVHGAQCMSVSGQCLMSAIIGSRSANQGLCAQPCRLPWSIEKGCGDYALSLKDMSLLEHLPKLEEMGVGSMKIEGRMKRPEYAALTAYSAKCALCGEAFDRELLEDVFSRGGFTDGYYKGERGRCMFGRRTEEDAVKSAAANPKIHELYRHEHKLSRLDFFVSIKKGEPLKVKCCDENGLCAEYTGEVPDASKSKPCDEIFVEKALSKLGDTFFEYGNGELEIDEGLFVSSAQLNAARRSLTEQMAQKRRDFFTHKIPFDDNALDSLELNKRKEKRAPVKRPALRAVISNSKQLEAVLESKSVELCFLPPDIGLIKYACERFDKDKLGISMPQFSLDEKRDFKLLEEAHALGINRILCHGIAQLEMAHTLSLCAHASIRQNITNSYALKVINALGAKDAVLSAELKAEQINKIEADCQTGAFAYGRLPLMLNINCPLYTLHGDSCKNCKGELFDRTGRTFKVRCSKQLGYVEILNSDLLSISDKQGDFTVDFFELHFFDENKAQTATVIDAFKSGKPVESRCVTRGLYYRGLKNGKD